MKLRILGNHIRLRLSQSEVKDFEKNGVVGSHTDFDGSLLKYILKKDQSTDDVSASFKGQVIEIKVGEKKATLWENDEEIGFENDDQTYLRVLVEKDFQCLHKRPKEDESDSFPNPLAT